MTNPKRTIMLVLLFMVIGIAAVTTNVVISGSTSIVKNPDDFNVYFSNVLVNGTQDLSLVRNDKTLVFNKDFSALNEKIEISYDVTNGSKDYDAQVSIDCTPSTEYLTITNDFDTDTNLAARSTKTGVLSVVLSKTNTGADITEEISCTISANAAERTSQVTGTVANPVNPYYIGREVSIGEEKFNIISEQEDSITMLAQYNIGTDYKQSEEENNVTFSDSTGWENTPGPQEIDIQQYDGETKTLLNNYVSSLKTEYGLDVTGDLITMEELGNLGCTVPTDYGFVSDSSARTCTNSPYKSWLMNAQKWWTHSAYSRYSDSVWIVRVDGDLDNGEYFDNRGVRPTITISKEVAEQLINVYPIGKEISIGTEKFNVISDNGTTVSMLAQKNVSDSTFTQTNEQMFTVFSSNVGWEYTPGPKEVDIQQWGGTSKTVLNNYLSYLNTEYSVTVKGDFITVSELKKLGCSAPTNYIWGDYDCNNSQYSDWLVNGQSWWTRSASAEHNNRIWILGNDGYLWINYNDASITDPSGVRPVITISKENLERLDDIIYFTIYGERYMAYKGMTWDEWCDSEFNVIGYYVEDGYVYTDNGISFWDYLSHVEANEIIEPREYSSAGTDPV